MQPELFGMETKRNVVLNGLRYSYKAPLDTRYNESVEVYRNFLWNWACRNKPAAITALRYHTTYIGIHFSSRIKILFDKDHLIEAAFVKLIVIYSNYFAKPPWTIIDDNI